MNTARDVSEPYSGTIIPRSFTLPAFGGVKVTPEATRALLALDRRLADKLDPAERKRRQAENLFYFNIAANDAIRQTAGYPDPLQVISNGFVDLELMPGSKPGEPPIIIRARPTPIGAEPDVWPSSAEEPSAVPGSQARYNDHQSSIRSGQGEETTDGSPNSSDKEPPGTAIQDGQNRNLDSGADQGGGSKKPPSGDGDIAPPPDEPGRRPPPPGGRADKQGRIIPRLDNSQLGEIMGWGRKADGAEKAITELSSEKIQIMINNGGLTQDEVIMARDFYRGHDIGGIKEAGVAGPRARLMQEILNKWPK